jgi:hypothetical protein
MRLGLLIGVVLCAFLITSGAIGYMEYDKKSKSDSARINDRIDQLRDTITSDKCRRSAKRYLKTKKVRKTSACSPYTNQQAAHVLYGEKLP